MLKGKLISSNPPVISCFLLEVHSYGFNGKELDSEGMGGGSSTYDYGFRIYNPPLAKFLSVDPLTQKFAFYSPFQYAGNKPIVAMDLDGLENYWVHSWKIGIFKSCLDIQKVFSTVRLMGQTQERMNHRTSQ